LQSRFDEILAAGGDVVAICVDPVEKNAEVAGNLGIEFPILADTELEATNAYGLLHEAGAMDGADIARPGVFIVDRGGDIAFRDLTDNWRVRVRPDEVIEELQKIP